MLAQNSTPTTPTPIEKIVEKLNLQNSLDEQDQRQLTLLIELHAYYPSLLNLSHDKKQSLVNALQDIDWQNNETNLATLAEKLKKQPLLTNYLNNDDYVNHAITVVNLQNLKDSYSVPFIFIYSILLCTVIFATYEIYHLLKRRNLQQKIKNALENNAGKFASKEQFKELFKQYRASTDFKTSKTRKQVNQAIDTLLMMPSDKNEEYLVKLVYHKAQLEQVKGFQSENSILHLLLSGEIARVRDEIEAALAQKSEQEQKKSRERQRQLTARQKLLGLLNNDEPLYIQNNPQQGGNEWDAYGNEKALNLTTENKLSDDALTKLLEAKLKQTLYELVRKKPEEAESMFANVRSSWLLGLLKAKKGDDVFDRMLAEEQQTKYINNRRMVADQDGKLFEEKYAEEQASWESFFGSGEKYVPSDEAIVENIKKQLVDALTQLLKANPSQPQKVFGSGLKNHLLVQLLSSKSEDNKEIFQVCCYQALVTQAQEELHVQAGSVQLTEFFYQALNKSTAPAIPNDTHLDTQISNFLQTQQRHLSTSSSAREEDKEEQNLTWDAAYQKLQLAFQVRAKDLVKKLQQATWMLDEALEQEVKQFFAQGHLSVLVSGEKDYSKQLFCDALKEAGFLQQNKTVRANIYRRLFERRDEMRLESFDEEFQEAFHTIEHLQESIGILQQSAKDDSYFFHLQELSLNPERAALIILQGEKIDDFCAKCCPHEKSMLLDPLTRHMLNTFIEYARKCAETKQGDDETQQAQADLLHTYSSYKLFASQFGSLLWCLDHHDNEQSIESLSNNEISMPLEHTIQETITLFKQLNFTALPEQTRLAFGRFLLSKLDNTIAGIRQAHCFNLSQASIAKLFELVTLIGSHLGHEHYSALRINSTLERLRNQQALPVAKASSSTESKQSEAGQPFKSAISEVSHSLSKEEATLKALSEKEINLLTFCANIQLVDENGNVLLNYEDSEKKRNEILNTKEIEKSITEVDGLIVKIQEDFMGRSEHLAQKKHLQWLLSKLQIVGKRLFRKVDRVNQLFVSLKDFCSDDTTEQQKQDALVAAKKKQLKLRLLLATLAECSDVPQNNVEAVRPTTSLPKKKKAKKAKKAKSNQEIETGSAAPSSKKRKKKVRRAKIFDRAEDESKCDSTVTQALLPVITKVVRQHDTISSLFKATSCEEYNSKFHTRLKTLFPGEANNLDAFTSAAVKALRSILASHLYWPDNLANNVAEIDKNIRTLIFDEKNILRPDFAKARIESQFACLCFCEISLPRILCGENLGKEGNSSNPEQQLSLIIKNQEFFQPLLPSEIFSIAKEMHELFTQLREFGQSKLFSSGILSGNQSLPKLVRALCVYQQSNPFTGGEAAWERFYGHFSQGSSNDLSEAQQLVAALNSTGNGATASKPCENDTENLRLALSSDEFGNEVKSKIVKLAKLYLTNWEVFQQFFAEITDGDNKSFIDTFVTSRVAGLSENENSPTNYIEKVKEFFNASFSHGEKSQETWHYEYNLRRLNNNEVKALTETVEQRSENKFDISDDLLKQLLGAYAKACESATAYDSSLIEQFWKILAILPQGRVAQLKDNIEQMVTAFSRYIAIRAQGTVKTGRFSVSTKDASENWIEKLLPEQLQSFLAQRTNEYNLEDPLPEKLLASFQSLTSQSLSNKELTILKARLVKLLSTFPDLVAKSADVINSFGRELKKHSDELHLEFICDLLDINSEHEIPAGSITEELKRSQLLSAASSDAKSDAQSDKPAPPPPRPVLEVSQAALKELAAKVQLLISKQGNHNALVEAFIEYVTAAKSGMIKKEGVLIASSYSIQVLLEALDFTSSELSSVTIPEKYFVEILQLFSRLKNAAPNVKVSDSSGCKEWVRKYNEQLIKQFENTLAQLLHTSSEQHDEEFLNKLKEASDGLATYLRQHDQQRYKAYLSLLCEQLSSKGAEGLLQPIFDNLVCELAKLEDAKELDDSNVQDVFSSVVLPQLPTIAKCLIQLSQSEGVEPQKKLVSMLKNTIERIGKIIISNPNQGYLEVSKFVKIVGDAINCLSSSTEERDEKQCEDNQPSMQSELTQALAEGLTLLFSSLRNSTAPSASSKKLSSQQSQLKSLVKISVEARVTAKAFYNFTKTAIHTLILAEKKFSEAQAWIAAYLRAVEWTKNADNSLSELAQQYLNELLAQFALLETPTNLPFNNAHVDQLRKQFLEMLTYVDDKRAEPFTNALSGLGTYLQKYDEAHKTAQHLAFIEDLIEALNDNKRAIPGAVRKQMISCLQEQCLSMLNINGESLAKVQALLDTIKLIRPEDSGVQVEDKLLAQLLDTFKQACEATSTYSEKLLGQFKQILDILPLERFDDNESLKSAFKEFSTAFSHYLVRLPKETALLGRTDLFATGIATTLQYLCDDNYQELLQSPMGEVLFTQLLEAFKPEKPQSQENGQNDEKAVPIEVTRKRFMAVLSHLPSEPPAKVQELLTQTSNTLAKKHQTEKVYPQFLLALMQVCGDTKVTLSPVVYIAIMQSLKNQLELPKQQSDEASSKPKVSFSDDDTVQLISLLGNVLIHSSLISALKQDENLPKQLCETMTCLFSLLLTQPNKNKKISNAAKQSKELILKNHQALLEIDSKPESDFVEAEQVTSQGKSSQQAPMSFFTVSADETVLNDKYPNTLCSQFVKGVSNLENHFAPEGGKSGMAIELSKLFSWGR
jgi:hypothetical protein